MTSFEEYHKGQFDDLKESDAQIYELIAKEYARLQNNIELLAAENQCSRAVLAALGSVVQNKTAEGFPGARFHGGCEVIDDVERLAVARAKEAFGAQYADVQPHSGTGANHIVITAVLEKGDKILSLGSEQGGHYSHGDAISLTGRFFAAESYYVDKKTFLLDYDAIRDKAVKAKPKLIICGASFYVRTIDFKRFREIADEVGAYLLADISHISGLVAAGAHPSPVALLYALFNGIQSLVVWRREQVGLGHTADCLDMRGNLGRHQQAAVAGLGALPDLDQDPCGVFDHIRHGLDDTVPAEVSRSDLQDHILEVAALEQPDRHTALPGAHAHRQPAFLIEVSHRHRHCFPHPPGQRADRHVADDYRVDPANRGSVPIFCQLPVLADGERKPGSRENTAQRRQAVEGVTLGIEARVGHLGNTADTERVEGAILRVKVVATATLGAGTGTCLVNHLKTGIRVALRADSIVRAYPLADTTAAAVVLQNILLGNDRRRVELDFRFRGFGIRECFAATLNFRGNGAEGTGCHAGAAQGAALGIVNDLPGKVVAGQIVYFYCFHRWTSRLLSTTTISRSFG